MTVRFIVFNSVYTILIVLSVVAIISHAISHALGNVQDDFLIRCLDLGEFSDDTVKLNQQLAILLMRMIPIEAPALFRQDLIKPPKNRLFGFQRYCHIIFDGVKTA